MDILPGLASPAAAVAAFSTGIAAMAAVQASRAPAAPARRWLLLVLAACAAVAAGDAVRHLGIAAAARWLGPVADAALLVLGPATWLYARAIADPGLVPARRPAWHLLPAALACVLLLAGAALDPVPASQPVGRDAAELVALAPVALQLGLYGIALARLVRRLHRRLHAVRANVEGRDLRWAGVLFGLYGAALLAWVGTWHWPVAAADMPTDLLLAMAAAWAGLHGGRQQAEPVPAPPRYERARLSDAHAADIGAALARLMEDEQPHLEADLTLAALSGRAGVTPHQLSQYLSLHAGQSFYDYVNGWRVEAVRRALARDASGRRPLLEIALECGFGSKSAFNAAFRRVTGTTPTAYRASLDARASSPVGQAASGGTGRQAAAPP